MGQCPPRLEAQDHAGTGARGGAESSAILGTVVRFAPPESSETERRALGISLAHIQLVFDRFKSVRVSQDLEHQHPTKNRSPFEGWEGP